MKTRQLSREPSIEALRSQLRRIVVHRMICRKLSTVELDQFCDLAQAIFSSFNFERNMRRARKTDAERAVRRSKAASKKALEKKHLASEAP